MATLFYIILLGIIIAVAPALTILSVNTLFGVGIELNIWTWLSSFWLTGVFGGGMAKKMKK